jgi:SAM-dependent methyltransferase
MLAQTDGVLRSPGEQEHTLMSFLTTNVGQFAYFDSQLSHPTWRGKRILDFGGNTGNILKDPNSTIEPPSYCCLDVSRIAVERGKAAHPNAHFIFYDRYSFEYNPNGIRDLELPDVGTTFDFILALSVFTHTPKSEMILFVHQLSTLLAEGGLLAFTFLDPHHVPCGGETSNLEYYAGRNGLRAPDRLLRRVEAARHAEWCELANDELSVDSATIEFPQPSRNDRYIVFYTEKYLKSLLGDVRILPPVEPFPRQHCCIVRR